MKLPRLAPHSKPYPVVIDGVKYYDVLNGIHIRRWAYWPLLIVFTCCLLVWFAYDTVRSKFSKEKG